MICTFSNYLKINSTSLKVFSIHKNNSFVYYKNSFFHHQNFLNNFSSRSFNQTKQSISKENYSNNKLFLPYNSSFQPKSISFHLQKKFLSTNENVELGQEASDVIENLKRSELVTPVLAQYLQLKEQYPQYILMFRLGDFYEMFFQDAVIASKALNITLTSRSTKSKWGAKVPMCGFPHHNLDTFLDKLIKQGKLVAICDQVEDVQEAKKNKRLIKREITRLVTPGTLVEDKFLNPTSPNYILSIVKLNDQDENLGLSWADLSTGEFQVMNTTYSNLDIELSRLSPVEILIFRDLANDSFLQKFLKKYHLTILDSIPHRDLSIEIMKKSNFDQAIVDLNEAELKAASLILKYIGETQMKSKVPLLSPTHFFSDTVMRIDATSKKSLELTSTFSGELHGSLLNVIDLTVTNSGGRLLKSFLNAPLLKINQINERLESVEFFFKNRTVSNSLIEILKECHDIERCMQRVFLNKCGPRDLVHICSTLARAQQIQTLLEPVSSEMKPFLRQFYENLFHDLSEVVNEILSALVEHPPISIHEGKFIKTGYSKKLDEQIELQEDSARFIEELQTKYKQETGVNNLRIKKKNIGGYFIEISIKDQNKIPTYFSFYQTASKQSRYKTQELINLESKLSNSESLALEIEWEIFETFCDRIVSKANHIMNSAKSLAHLDVFSALAKVAIERNYTKPIVSDSVILSITEGQHPTLQAIQMERGNVFVHNDCFLSSEGKLIWLITGPNMGGKSTFLRQNALITILAQMGSFVPAKRAEVGVIDSIYTRIGAGDDLTKDISTFMMEMLETSRILKRATSKSLVIMDEVGRGTSTYDGLSIAWSVLEYLHNISKCRTLFATHYHELTQLESTLEKLECKTLSVKEMDGNVVFTYRVIPGTADKSYGIHAAELSGMPMSVVNRAKEILASLDKKSPSK